MLQPRMQHQLMLQVRVTYFKLMLMFPCRGALPDFYIKTSTPLTDVYICLCNWKSSGAPWLTRTLWGVQHQPARVLNVAHHQLLEWSFSAPPRWRTALRTSQRRSHRYGHEKLILAQFVTIWVPEISPKTSNLMKMPLKNSLCVFDYKCTYFPSTTEQNRSFYIELYWHSCFCFQFLYLMFIRMYEDVLCARDFQTQCSSKSNTCSRGSY